MIFYRSKQINSVNTSPFLSEVEIIYLSTSSIFLQVQALDHFHLF